MSMQAWPANLASLFNITRASYAETQGDDLPPHICWSLAEIGQALNYLVQKSGLPTTGDDAANSSIEATAELSAMLRDEALDRWMDAYADSLGLEAEPFQSTYAEVNQLLSSAGPALLMLPPAAGTSKPRFVALVQSGPRGLNVVARDGSIRRIWRGLLADALWADAIGAKKESIDQVLGRAGIAEGRRPRVQRAILQEVMGGTVRQNGWLLRVPPSVHLWYQVYQSGLWGMGRRLVGGYLVQLLLTIGAWWMIGQSVLAGHFERGWLWGWALVLLTTIPLQAWMNLIQSELAIGIGAIFKQRLLFGVMQFDPEEIRHQGAGQFLGRVLASDTVEQLGLASGFIALLAFFQLAAAVFILAAGIGGWLHAWLLILWAGVTVGLGWLYLRRSQAWVMTYREMTNDLVERMVGHRTRLAQEDRRQWHDMEDQMLDRYLRLQHKLDQIESQLKAVIPRGWMVVGVGGLLYALLSAQPTPTQIVVSIGGILYAYQALTTIVLGSKSIVNAQLAWGEIHTIFHAATREPAISRRGKCLPNGNAKGNAKGALPQAPILTTRDTVFRYHAQGRPVLQDCNLEIYEGEKLLLEGPSGGGKSTLAAILAGLRTPQSGLLLLHNVDQQSMGMAVWRQRVVMAPQFHENYILTGTLAFNLLMGRRWPPQPQDIAAAQTLCRELGLGDLLARMPAGMHQMVGESGWQLSHGERSRIFIARALLQEVDLLILDESFAALDPTNLTRTLRCVLARAPTLLVIAHP